MNIDLEAIIQPTKPITVADYNMVLSAIKYASGFDAVIAGGCLRDDYFKKIQPKDMDVFVVVPTDFPYADAIEIGNVVAKQIYSGLDSNAHCLPKGSSTYDDFKLRQDIVHVVGIAGKYGLPPIDIIFMDEDRVGTRFVSDTFDFSINQIEYSKLGYYRSKAFLETAATKVIKQIRENVDSSADRTQERIRNLTIKYPEFTWEFLNNSA